MTVDSNRLITNILSYKKLRKIKCENYGEKRCMTLVENNEYCKKQVNCANCELFQYAQCRLIQSHFNEYVEYA